MLRSALDKVMWAGRVTVFLVGLAAILAMVMGLASAAFSATGANFILGQSNSADKPTTLVGQIVDTTKSALVLNNPNGGSALRLRVNSGIAPIKVNSTAGKAINLNADKLDGMESSAFRPLVASVQSSGATQSLDVVSSARVNTGAYVVQFDRAVDQCARVATAVPPGNINPNEAVPSSKEVIVHNVIDNNGVHQPDKVAVFISGSNGNPNDSGFSLVVFC